MCLNCALLLLLLLSDAGDVVSVRGQTFRGDWNDAVDEPLNVYPGGADTLPRRIPREEHRASTAPNTARAYERV